MKALVTGAGGALGRELVHHLKKVDAEVITWNPQRLPPNQWQAATTFLDEIMPDVVYHLASPPVEVDYGAETEFLYVNWSARLAEWCRLRSVVFVVTSTVLVFSRRARGPFGLNIEADAEEGLGFLKRQAEQAVLRVNPDATVVRLGWQIANEPDYDNLEDFFGKTMTQDRVVRASRRWLPSCSFIDETARAVLALGLGDPGLHHFNANQRWSSFDIAQALNLRHGERWQVIANDDVTGDQRMLDPRLRPSPLEESLPELLELSVTKPQWLE